MVDTFLQPQSSWAEVEEALQTKGLWTQQLHWFWVLLAFKYWRQEHWLVMRVIWVICTVVTLTRLVTFLPSKVVTFLSSVTWITCCTTLVEVLLLVVFVVVPFVVVPLVVVTLEVVTLEVVELEEVVLAVAFLVALDVALVVVTLDIVAFEVVELAVAFLVLLAVVALEVVFAVTLKLPVTVTFDEEVLVVVDTVTLTVML